jgi:hypothetical protein
MRIGFVVAIISVIAIAGMFYLASMSENDWIAAQEPNHPPLVEVTREGPGVWIRWYGGWTSSFIDHIKVSCDGCYGCPTRLYKKPQPGQYIHYPLVPNNTSIVISVYDNAVQEYHIIKSVVI